MYMYIHHGDSKIHGNSSTDFEIVLPISYKLKGDWSCALLEVLIPTPVSEELYISVDIVQNSLVHGKLIPILKSFRESEQFNNPYYMPLRNHDITRMKFIIRTKDLKLPSSDIDKLCLILHFKNNIKA